MSNKYEDYYYDVGDKFTSLSKLLFKTYAWNWWYKEGTIFKFNERDILCKVVDFFL